MTRRWMLQSQASLPRIRIPASYMNFNDSSINFLDMHPLAPSECWVINQRPTLLFQSSVLTSALSHEGYRLGLFWSRKQYKLIPAVAPNMAEHLRSTCPPHKQGMTCTHTLQQYHRMQTKESINI